VHNLRLFAPGEYQISVVSANEQQSAWLETVQRSTGDPPVDQLVVMDYNDYAKHQPGGRGWLFKYRVVTTNPRPLCVTNGSVIYAEQPRSGCPVTIKIWRPGSNLQDRFVTQFRTRLGVDIMIDYCVGAWLSPSGRYLMLMLGTNMNLVDHDIRIVDLKAGTSHLAVYKRTISHPDVTWKGDTAIIGRVRYPFVIEMATGRTSFITDSGRIEN